MLAVSCCQVGCVHSSHADAVPSMAACRVGKADREAAAAGLPVAPREIVRKPLAIGGRGGGAKKRGRGRGGEDDEEEEEGYKGNRWGRSWGCAAVRGSSSGLAMPA